MVVLCQPIPGHYLLSLASDIFYFSPGHCTSELAKYDYSKSQLFIFMFTLNARKFWTERPTQSDSFLSTLIVDKRISFAYSVPEETENHQARQLF